MGGAGRETNLHEINICLCRYLRMQTHSEGGREGEKRERGRDGLPASKSLKYAPRK